MKYLALELCLALVALLIFFLSLGVRRERRRNLGYVAGGGLLGLLLISFFVETGGGLLGFSQTGFTPARFTFVTSFRLRCFR